MVIFITFSILAFNCCSTFIFFADKALVFKPFFINILNTFYTDNPILFLKIEFRHPNSTNIMNPYIMTGRNFSRISRFNKIVIVAFLLFLSSLSNYKYFILLLLFTFDLLSWNILFFLFIIRTFFRILIVGWICLLKEVDIDMN